MYQASNANTQAINTAFDYERINNQTPVATYNFDDYGAATNRDAFDTNNIENDHRQFQQQEIVIPADYNPPPQYQVGTDDLSFALDEINAVINSKEFVDILDKPVPLNPQVSNTYFYQQDQDRSNYQHIPSPTEQLVSGMATTNKSSNYNNYFAANGTTHNNEGKMKPYVEIVEQPAKCALRFRYKCEGRSAGSLPGVNSTATNKTFPSIKISGYEGRAVVVISCVTKDAPYMAHPHNIVGKEGCKKGICTIVINNEANTVRSFNSLGIQCVKRRDIEDSLALRESIHVDPYRNGFSHKSLASNIDLNVVRLCFQVFIEGSTPNKCDVPLVPVVSDPIHDKKAMSDLVITKLSHCSAPATGGREVILLCDRIAKDDIQIRFYEERNNKLIWETHIDIAPADVHKKVAICFKTPKYYNENISHPVMVRLQLKRISDNQVSEPRSFQFLPCESDEDIISRKRQKIEWVNMNHHVLDNILQSQQHYDNSQHVQQLQTPQHHLHQQTPEQTLRQPMRSPQAQQLSPRPSSSQQPSPSQNQLQQQQSFALPEQNSLQSHSRQPEQQQYHSKLPQRVMLIPQQPIPSPSNQNQHHQQQEHNAYPVQTSPNLVVRHEIIDNEGKVMRLVDRPNAQSNAQQQRDANQNDGNDKRPLASSLDRIDTSELMQNMQFNSNMDFNLGSNLSLH